MAIVKEIPFILCNLTSYIYGHEYNQTSISKKSGEQNRITFLSENTSGNTSINAPQEANSKSAFALKGAEGVRSGNRVKIL